MIFQRALRCLFAVGVCLSAPGVLAEAPDIQVDGSQQVAITLHNDPTNTHQMPSDGVPMASVSMPMIRLSEQAQAELQRRMERLMESTAMPQASEAAPKISVGMRGVPVLNQGVHGTCVTFAVTAALDATLYQKDHISQLCSLQLGSYLEEEQRDYVSGWNGSFAPLVLEQINTFGIVEKQHETSGACGGLRSYPVRSADTGYPMPIDKYLTISRDISSQVSTDEILSAEKAFSRRINRQALVENLKSSLREGHLIVAGLGLDPKAYNAGFVGNHKTYADTWVLTPELMDKVKQRKMNRLGYHEIIIHGYDDTVTVNNQQGVFVIRNSWGTRFGDHGDAYITYDYVKLLMTEANAIQRVH